MDMDKKSCANIRHGILDTLLGGVSDFLFLGMGWALTANTESTYCVSQECPPGRGLNISIGNIV
jgi:hypothetical protein